MLVSFVLRVVPDELARSRIVGHIEDVATGRQAPVRSVDDLVAFCAVSVNVTLPEPRPSGVDPAKDQSDA